MTDAKIREVIALYRKDLEALGAIARDYPHDQKPVAVGDILDHCLGMLDQMEAFIDQGRREKVFRWLGFVQACLWCTGIYVIDDMREHNRPSEPAD